MIGASAMVAPAMRELMTLTEAAGMHYFHCSPNKYEDGYILDQSQRDPAGPRLPFYVPEVEARLERVRPAHCLSRSQSLFMTIDAPSHWWGKYGYAVEPLASVERNDHGWLDIMAVDNGWYDMETDQHRAGFVRDQAYERMMDGLALHYWAGLALPHNYWNADASGPRDPDTPLSRESHTAAWEYRTASARVIRLVSVQ